MSHHKLKLKKKSGRIVDLPMHAVKRVLSTSGYTGKALYTATKGVLHQAGKLAKQGVVSATDVEKALVRAVSDTNKIVMNSAKKIVKEVLR